MGLENKTMYEIINMNGKGLENSIHLKDEGLKLL